MFTQLNSKFRFSKDLTLFIFYYNLDKTCLITKMFIRFFKTIVLAYEIVTLYQNAYLLFKHLMQFFRLTCFLTEITINDIQAVKLIKMLNT